MMDVSYIAKRLLELQKAKGISGQKMSLELGKNKNYINFIISGSKCPSMNEFLVICDYLDVQPSDFFDENVHEPALVSKAIKGIKHMSDKDLLTLISLIDRFNEENPVIDS